MNQMTCRKKGEKVMMCKCGNVQHKKKYFKLRKEKQKENSTLATIT